MKRGKRFGTAVLAAALAMGTMGGYGMSQVSAAEGEPIKLTMFSLGGSYDKYAKGAEAEAAVEAAILEDLGLNVDLNIIGDSESNDQIAVKIAAGELDAVSAYFADLTSWQNLIEKGALLPLDDLLAEYGGALMEEVDSKLWDPYKVDGTTYLIPIQAPVPFYCGTWVRMDLFRKYGIDEVPTTVSELIDGLRIICENEPDMVGISAGHLSWITNSGPMNFHLVDENGNMTRTNEDGTGMVKQIYTDSEFQSYVYWESDLFRQHMQRFADVYAEGILDPEIFTTSFDHVNDLIATDRVACIGSDYFFQNTADTKPEQEWTFLTNLTNDITGGATTWRYEYEVGMHVAIVSNSPYAEEIMQILNWAISSNENYALNAWGVEGEHWQYTEDGTRVERFQDDAGNYLVGGGLGGMLYNLRSDWYGPLTHYFEGEEWAKIYADEPTTRTWAYCDGFINYQYETDATTRTDMQTLASETLVNIVTGKVGVDEGLDKMAEALDSMGYPAFHEEVEEQYMTGMGLK